MAFQDLLNDSSLPRVVLVEVMPFDTGSALERRIGFSSREAGSIFLDGFLWEDRLASPIFTSQVAIGGSNFDVGGFARPTFGVVNILIGDTSTVRDALGTAFDLLNLNWDGRDLRVLLGAPGDAFGSFGVLFDGFIEDITWDENSFRLSIRDRAVFLDTEIQTNTFAGTGDLEGGVDLKDQLKPLVYGIRKNIEPVLVNAAKQIYVLHDGTISAIDDVFDEAVALVNAGDITTLSLPALDNWTPEGGKYITDLAQGAIRVGAEPAGLLTLDVQGDATGGFVSTTADIIERILTTRGGLVAGDLVTTSFSALNTAEPGSIGLYIIQRTSIQQILNTLLGALGAFGFAQNDGKIRVGKVAISASPLTADTTLITADSTVITADATESGGGAPQIEEVDIVALVREETPNPVSRVRVGYKGVGVVQTFDNINIPNNVASNPFNLMSGATLTNQEVGEFIYLDKVLIIDLGLFIGDVISGGIDVIDPTSDVVNVRAQLLFFDGADVQVGVTEEGNFIITATTLTRSTVEAVTIPVGAVKVTFQLKADSGAGDLLSQQPMLNLGTIALPFIPGVDVTSENTSQDTSNVDGMPAQNVREAALFGEDFSFYADQAEFEIAWESALGSGEVSFSTDSNSGGAAISLGNNAGNDERLYVHRTLIPYNPEALYRIEVTAKQTLGTATNKFSAGFVGVGQDGVTIVDVIGGTTFTNQHWAPASSITLGTSYGNSRGFFTGRAVGNAVGMLNANDPQVPGNPDNDVFFLRAAFRVHEGGSAGTTLVDVLRVDEIGGAIGEVDIVDTPQLQDDAVTTITSVVGSDTTTAVGLTTVATVIVNGVIGDEITVQWSVGTTLNAVSVATQLDAFIKQEDVIRFNKVVNLVNPGTETLSVHNRAAGEVNLTLQTADDEIKMQLGFLAGHSVVSPTLIILKRLK